jgi:tRNA (guanine37-N1)-methyltransferase
MAMKVCFISIFPDMFDSVMNTSMMRKAQEIGAAQFSYINLRDYGIGPRSQVDDIIYGGGSGMLLKPEPIYDAVAQAKKDLPNASVYFLGPKGEKLTQKMCIDLADQSKDMIIICGRYEGVDERVMSLVDRVISIGDYVITGGELSSMVLVDSIVRLLPGVLGGETSAEDESFYDGQTLECPHYTRPEDFKGMKVPEVLLSGNHAEIEKWRTENSQKI